MEMTSLSDQYPEWALQAIRLGGPHYNTPVPFPTFKLRTEMKISVSSKAFGYFLNSVEDIVHYAWIDIPKGEIVLEDSNGEHRYLINGKSWWSNEKFIQEDVRYDWLRDHLQKIQEQPITIVFSENNVRITFDF